MFLANTLLGSGPDGFRRLDGTLAALGRDPIYAGIELDAFAFVPHQDVVRALDAALAAGLDDVMFVGPPPRR